MDVSPRSLKHRLLSASYYIGLAPVTKRWGSRSGSPVVEHHFQQAHAALFLALMVFAAACAFEIVSCLLLIRFPALEKQHALQLIWSVLEDAEFLVLGAFVLLWILLLILALAGSAWQVPLLKGLARRRWCIRVSVVAYVCILLLVPSLGLFGCWASTLTRRCSSDASVYFLYDEGITVPRWGYAMGLCRIALQADRNWGKGSSVLDRLTKETIGTALANGRVVILATHGADGYAATCYAPEVLGVWPADHGATDEGGSRNFLSIGIRDSKGQWTQVNNVSVSSRLQLAYVFACHGGDRAAEWREHLSPAQVVTYNRSSSVLDHALWFAFTGPAELKKLR